MEELKHKHNECDCEECRPENSGLTCGCSACKHKHGAKDGKEGFLNEHGFDLIKIIVSSLLLLSTIVFKCDDTVKVVLCIIAYFISAYEIFINCIKGIANKNFLDENTLMFIASVTAFCLGNYSEGVFIVVLYALGELLEDVATDNSRKKIAGLSELKSVTARVITKTGFADVSPASVEVGTLIEVRKGDRVPIDGILVGASAEFDMKAITGESKPYVIEDGQTVYSGAINTGNSVVIKTTKLYKDSTVEKIISMVEGANAQKAKSQKFITSFAKVYTPIVVLAALVVAFIPPLFDGMNFSFWIYKALSFLVVSCPCALVISVPLAFFTGIGNMAKNGVLVKGSNYIDALAGVKTTAFDKTGTLTKGEFGVESVKTFSDMSEEEVIAFAAALESKSTHPISKAICARNGGESVLKAENVKEISGKGIAGTVKGRKILVGNAKLMVDNDIEIDNDNYYGTVIYVAADGKLAGKIYICDSIKEEARETIELLKNAGVNETVMFSGDNATVCEKVGNQIKIDRIYSELLPEQKAEKLNELKQKNNGKVLFAGDGINDAPSLALADVGVAMGALGSEIAVESADVVIMDDDIKKIPYAIKKSKTIRRKVIENIAGSLAIKAIIMLLTLTTGVPVWLAMFGDVGVMLLAVLNSLTIR